MAPPTIRIPYAMAKSLSKHVRRWSIIRASSNVWIIQIGMWIVSRISLRSTMRENTMARGLLPRRVVTVAVMAMDVTPCRVLILAVLPAPLGSTPYMASRPVGRRVQLGRRVRLGLRVRPVPIP